MVTSYHGLSCLSIVKLYKILDLFCAVCLTNHPFQFVQCAPKINILITCVYIAIYQPSICRLSPSNHGTFDFAIGINVNKSNVVSVFLNLKMCLVDNSCLTPPTQRQKWITLVIVSNVNCKFQIRHLISKLNLDLWFLNSYYQIKIQKSTVNLNKNFKFNCAICYCDFKTEIQILIQKFKFQNQIQKSESDFRFQFSIHSYIYSYTDTYTHTVAHTDTLTYSFIHLFVYHPTFSYSTSVL